MEQKYNLVDGSYHLAIVNGKMEHLTNCASYNKHGIGWAGKVFSILAECRGLPAENGLSRKLLEVATQWNDTIIKSDDGLIMFTQKRFLKPVVCPCCGK